MLDMAVVENAIAFDEKSKSSVKKYQTMQNAVCNDSRAHGMFQFYGVNRSGRWAGRLIQLQDLPQNHLTDLADARELIRTGDYDMLQLLYDDIPDTLSADSYSVHCKNRLQIHCIEL